MNSRTKTEIESLQNAANCVNVIVHQKFTHDKRKSLNEYFLTHNGTSIGPTLKYQEMNYFILGMIQASKLNLTKN